MAPLDLSSIAGSISWYLIFLLIGVAFGAVLEMSGFGDSRKLAAQFFLKDMTVLKVMFTAIIVAAVLISASSALGLLDMSKVWVNPTYLLPGVAGGLIMGVGFIIGGFCPGTSLVAASTLKLDGVAFVGGVGLGTLLFSETAGLLGDARHATDMGRFTLDELFHIPLGVTVLLLVALALIMFYGAELAERYFGRGEKIDRKALLPSRKPYIAAAATVLGISIVFAFIGQPSSIDRWESIARASGVSLQHRDPYIHPAEVVEWRQDISVYTRIIDVRSEGDFNNFHLAGAMHVSLSSLANKEFVKALKNVPDNTLTFVVSNTEEYATAAWKALVGGGLKNAYIIEGGINKWLSLYPPDLCIAKPLSSRAPGKEEMAFIFEQSVGENCYASHPEALYKERPIECDTKQQREHRAHEGAQTVRSVPFDENQKFSFTRKVKMQKKKKTGGGCG